jgi:hypothetical protein
MDNQRWQTVRLLSVEDWQELANLYHAHRPFYDSTDDEDGKKQARLERIDEMLWQATDNR